MNNKKDDGVILVIFLAIIITEILSFKLDIGVVDSRSLGNIIFGIALMIYYLITKMKNKDK